MSMQPIRIDIRNGTVQRFTVHKGFEYSTLTITVAFTGDHHADGPVLVNGVPPDIHMHAPMLGNLDALGGLGSQAALPPSEPKMLPSPRGRPGRFLLFCGDTGRANPGWRDFAGSFDTRIEAQSAAEAWMEARSPLTSWWQVVDLFSAMVVVVGGTQ